jgi:HAMP domain-containing protein
MTIPPYLLASRRVRQTFARYELGNVLLWAFDAQVPALPDDQLDEFLYGLQSVLRTVEPALATVAGVVAAMSRPDIRAELTEAFERIRTLAQDVAAGHPTGTMPVTVDVYLPDRAEDRDGRPRFGLHARLADALVWMAARLFSEVPRSLIRPCAFAGCARVYVAVKNQRFCLPHQREAMLAAQRRAVRAFRTRAAKTRKTTRRKTKR